MQRQTKKLGKKADIPVKTLVEIIIFVVIFLTIGLPIITKIVSFFVDAPEQGTFKSLQTLRVELNNAEQEIKVPVYVDAEHSIQGFKTDSAIKPSDKYKCEKDKSCICVCKGSYFCSEKDGNINKCMALDAKLSEDFIIRPKLVDKDDNVVEKGGEASYAKCKLAIADKIIKVSECIV